MCEALDTPKKIEEYPKLKKIRYIRNDSIGHPTKRGLNKSHSYHFISRFSLTANGFQLLSNDSNGRSHSSDVCVTDIISDQKKYISEILESVIQELEVREVDHREKFKHKKLELIFGNNLEYHLGKICDGTVVIPDVDTKIRHGLGIVNLSLIKDRLKSFQEALSERGLESRDDIVYLYGLIDYPLNELEAYFNGSETSINDETAYIFAYFLNHNILELQNIAQDIDNEYNP